MVSLLTQPWMVRLRNGLRHNAVAKMIYHRWMAGHRYEERFGQRLLGAIEPGAVVWDIGANVGLYVRQFLERGAARVIAFEPAPEAVSELRHHFGDHDAEAGRVTIVPVALSDASGSASFAADGSSPTNRIVSNVPAAPGERDRTVTVPVVRADEALERYGLPTPSVIKIDVEGFELEVLRGLGSLLDLPGLRSVFVEVHFALLHERGLDEAPSAIDALLRQHGFKVEWPDLSHACAVRVTH